MGKGSLSIQGEDFHRKSKSGHRNSGLPLSLSGLMTGSILSVPGSLSRMHIGGW